MTPIRIDGHPEIVAIHADADSKYVAGEGWHSDLSADEAPPLGSILYLHTIPKTGGDTMFSSMYKAYDALSDRMKSYLEGLEAVHDANPVYHALFKDYDKRYPVATHPVIRTHPVTGKKCIFVNSSYKVMRFSSFCLTMSRTRTFRCGFSGNHTRLLSGTIVPFSIWRCGIIFQRFGPATG